MGLHDCMQAGAARIKISREFCKTRHIMLGTVYLRLSIKNTSITSKFGSYLFSLEDLLAESQSVFVFQQLLIKDAV